MEKGAPPLPFFMPASFAALALGGAVPCRSMEIGHFFDRSIFKRLRLPGHSHWQGE